MRWRFLFFTLMLSGLLGALAGSAAMSPLVIWISSEADRAYYEDMVKRYRADVDPGFQAEVRAYGFREMPDKLAVAIRTGIGAPDVVQLEESFFSLYLAGEIPFVDLTDRVAKSGLNRAILPQRWPLFSYRGRIYGVPQSLSAILLYYRADLFAELGIRPEEIDTWEKFIAVGRRIHADDRYMLALDASYFDILLRQRGQDLFDASGNLTITTPLAVDTLEWIVKLKEMGVATLPPRGSIFDPVFITSDLSSGRVLTVLGADWFALDLLKGMAPDLEGKWRAMPLPRWTDGRSQPGRTTSSYAGQGLLIYRGSKQVEKAWDFIEYVMAHKEANVQRFLQGNSFSAHRPSWDDPRLLQGDPYFGGQSLASVLMRVADQVPVQHQFPERAQVVFLMMDKYWSAVVGGRLSPEEALRQLAAEVEGGGR